MKENKYRYICVIQGNYGYGFEDVCEYDRGERRQALQDLKEYRKDGYNATYRLIERRVARMIPICWRVRNVQYVASDGDVHCSTEVVAKIVELCETSLHLTISGYEQHTH